MLRQATILRKTTGITGLRWQTTVASKIPSIKPVEMSAAEFWKKTTFESTKDMVPVADRPMHTGRAWDIHALRRKDWSDLHQLWWVLLRERNRLLTANIEIKRYTVYNLPASHIRANIHSYEKVKQSMANIKAVIKERQTAFTQAQKLWGLFINEQVNIFNPSIYQKLMQMEKDQRLISNIVKHGRFTWHRGLEYARKVTELKEEASEALKSINRRKRTVLRKVETSMERTVVTESG